MTRIRIKEKQIADRDVFGTEENGEITIDPRQGPYEKLDTEIHELIHALWPEEIEKSVHRKARKMSKALWRLNYRKVVEV